MPIAADRNPMKTVAAPVEKFCVNALVCFVGCYQRMIRPHLIGCCKFYPTCSDYAMEALSRFGLRRGLALAFRRIIRCHPFGPGGIDPVPRHDS